MYNINKDYKDDIIPTFYNLYYIINKVGVKYPNLAKWFIFKINASTIFDFDCDVTKEVLENLCNCQSEIFEGATFKKNGTYKFKISHENKLYYADTMNSFWNPFKAFMQVYLVKELGLEGGNIPKDKWKLKENKHIWIYHFCDNYDKILKVEHHKILKKFDEFARLTHTIGNMLIVPIAGGDKNFQKTKGSYEFGDYIDLALIDIKKYCDENEYTKLVTKDNKYWMAKYDNNFKNFIEKNHLTMYLDEESPTTIQSLFDKINYEKFLELAKNQVTLETSIKKYTIKLEKATNNNKSSRPTYILKLTKQLEESNSELEKANSVLEELNNELMNKIDTYLKNVISKIEIRNNELN